MENSILIYGAGGHGKVVLDILLESGANVVGFIDDNKHKRGTNVIGYEVFGDWSYLQTHKHCSVALGIGDNSIRQSIFYNMYRMSIKIISAIHPTSVISRFSKLGSGLTIMAGTIIGADTIIEDGVVMNTCSSIDHDCYLEKFSQIWPGAHLAGAVRVGMLSYIGLGSSVIQNVKIGKYCIIGAGSVVISDIPDNVTAFGVPARVIKADKNIPT